MKIPIPTFVALLTILVFSGCNRMKPEPFRKEIESIENGLLLRRHIKGQPIQKFNLADRMKYHMIPGLSIAIIKDGELRWAKGYGEANTQTGQKIDSETLFQAGSISKPIAALSVLKLVEDGILDLDIDVNQYLKTWKVPENEHTTEEKVTLRRLLTHSAGITIHGFEGYSQDESIPTIDEVLNGNGNSKRITVNNTPGSEYRYSGGGYTIIEKIVEDVAGLPFEQVMRLYVLDPLDMHNSTYEQPLPQKLHKQSSAAFDRKGQLIDGLWHNYPEQAAAGLWTTPSDIAKYCMEIQRVLAGAKPKVISMAAIEMMLTKHKKNYGLGPELHSNGDSLVFAHDGKNEGFTNIFGAFAYSGNGVVIMTNADNGNRIIDEILRSVSTYYNWDIANQKAIEPAQLSGNYLQNFVGSYKYEEQIPDIGDYVIQAYIDNNQLIFKDTIEERTYKQTYILFPLDSTEFQDLENGEKFQFQFNEQDNNLVEGFLWDGDERFVKL